MKQSMKKPKIFISCVILVVVILSITQVIVSNSLSTTGFELGKIQDEMKRYQTENALLSERLLTESSLTHISSTAAQLGFVEAKNQVYLGTPLPLALKQ